MITTIGHHSTIRPRMWCSEVNRKRAKSENPVAAWPMWEGDGNTIRDPFGGHIGTLTNGPMWVASPYGPALDFAGSGESVDCGDADEYDGVSEWSFLLHVLIRGTGEGGSGRLFDKGWAGPYLCYASGADFLWRTNNGQNILTCGITRNVWITLVFVWSASRNLKGCYQDGRLIASAGAAGVLTANATQLTIGNLASGGTRAADAMFAGCMMWSGRSLIPNEIQEHCADPFALFRPAPRIFPAAAAPPSGGPFPHYVRCAMQGGMIGMGT